VTKTDRNERHRDSAKKAVRDIRSVTRRKYSAEEKIRILLEGLRSEEAIASDGCCDKSVLHVTF
jgi:transposase